MVFFDGEEAFKEWTKNDSLYGSRHLAEVWSNTTHPKGSNATMIDTIVSIKESYYNFKYYTRLGEKPPTKIMYAGQKNLNTPCTYVVGKVLSLYDLVIVLYLHQALKSPSHCLRVCIPKQLSCFP